MQKGGFVARTRCPKCGGSVYLDSDLYGWFEECLQCGHTRNLKKVSKVNIDVGGRYVHEVSRVAAKVR